VRALGPPRRAVALLAVAVPVVLSVALLAGCSSIPTSGPVKAGRDLRLERENSAVRVIGQPPVPDARPQDIVRGFLQAGADFVNDHAIARLYLAPEVRQRWQPGTSTSIYDRAEGAFSVQPVGNNAVTLQAAQVARIDGEGHYLRTSQGTRLTRTFGMERVNGQWRISSLDNGLLLTRGDVQETFRQLNLYFLAPSRAVLVPDTIFLPSVAGLSTVLVNRLLHGPSAPLRGAVRTAFPRGTELAVSSVPVRNGIARVNLDASVLQADDSARVLLSAQLLWTLKQLPEFQGLRVTADGKDLGVRGQGQVQPREAWRAYDPAGLIEGSIAYVVRGGRVGRVVDGRFTPVVGAAGDGRVTLRRPAVSLDAAKIAGLSADGRSLLAGRITEEGTLPVRLRAGTLSAPSWDASGNLWVVDSSVGRVWMVPEGTGEPTAVGLPRIAGRINGLRVARDGARVAVITGSGPDARLLVGAILRQRGAPQARIAALREVLPQLRAVRDVAWADATTLAVLGVEGSDPGALLLVDSDGYAISAVEPQPGLVSVAAAPSSRPLLAGTGDGRLLQYTAGRSWVELGPGSDPAYPG
jgi:lipoprotein LpqB-like beta-propeller protein/sporulation and spore germination protein